MTRSPKATAATAQTAIVAASFAWPTVAVSRDQ